MIGRADTVWVFQIESRALRGYGILRRDALWAALGIVGAAAASPGRG